MTVCTGNELLEECHQWVQLFLKDFGPDDIFFDAEFEYSDGSLKWDEYGTILHYNALRNNDASPLFIYKDSWPFHADQGQIGDCWLMATLMTIAQRRNLLEKIIPPNDFSLKHGIFLVRSLGYLMTASTICKFDNGKATQNGLAKNHAYSLLDTCVHNDHRLVLIGCPNYLNWKGKWSELPPYNEEIAKEWNDSRKEMVKKRFSWMEIDDLCRWFERLQICKYREGWHELRTGKFQMAVYPTKNGKIDFTEKIYTKVLRLRVRSRCKLLAEIMDRYEDCHYPAPQRVVGLVNIHKVTTGNQIGDLIVSSTINLYWSAFKSQYRSAEGDECELSPGFYFVIYTVVSMLYPMEYSWVLRSPTPMDHITYDSVTFKNKVASHQSLLKMVEKLAKPKTEVRKGLFAQEYSRDNFLTLMFENHAEKPIDINVVVRTKSENVKSYGMMTERLWNRYISTSKDPYVGYITIPPRSKLIFGNVWVIPGPIQLKNEILDEEIESGRAKLMRYKKVHGAYEAIRIR
ncbi:hypothetical protein GCK72_020844 [Caenorhabditis remanei]|uniref:Calpain catalytic domain-containing protein n=1 Tax=Caenorhabditis remanei TaxID=31234 RepID=A0A6A5GHN8_CAERE|nr:hypothetical protein GCK72_020844 [Caenorhabditis remanei]KAF1754284.1 hypothetical protein GCK72_020844 [Caenorhabditis remanei]